MELSERLERIERTKDISEIAEHVRWMKDEGVPEEKKAVVDRTVADAVWRAVQDDINSLLVFGQMNPAMAVNQHGRHALYYKRLEKAAGTVFGEHSAAAKVAKQAGQAYAGKIVGVGILGSVRMGPREMAQIARLVSMAKRLAADVRSSHGVIKASYTYGRMTGMTDVAARGVVATGIEAKVFGVPRQIMIAVDKSTPPRETNVMETAERSVPAHYGKEARGIARHSTKETARAAVRTAEGIRKETAVVEHIVGAKAKSWSQKALDELYRKLRALAKKQAELGDVEGAKHLLHAAMKVRGYLVRER